MRVVFLGNAPWSVPPLEALAESEHEVALVVTRVPKPAGRGHRPAPTPVAGAARGLELPLLEVPTVKSGPGFDAMRDAAPDVLAVVAYGELVPQPVLDLPRIAPVNLHFSLLPELRGAAPVQRALMNGMTVTGVTTIRMDAGMDTGPILLQSSVRIEGDDDASALGARLATIGGRLLVKTLAGLESAAIEEHPQDESRATYAPKLTPDDRVLRWERHAADIANQIRALAPDPGATTRYRGRLLKVFRAEATTGPSGAPGALLEGSRKELRVATADGALRLLEVAPEGRRRMSGAEFVRGYRPERGERLG